MQKRCPKCDMTLKDILDSGVVGCSTCYEIFHDELFPIIKELQNHTRHFGKNPNPKIVETKLKYIDVIDAVERFERGEHG